MKVAIACGGTGGHLFPGVAVGEVLLERGHEVLLIISEKKIDEIAVAGHPHFRIEKIPSIAMPPLFSPAMIGFATRFYSAYQQCRKLYRDFTPDVVLGMGGFTSTAPVLAGRNLNAPTFIHESNVIPGKANRLNARISRRVLLGFHEAAVRFGKTPCMVTGTPVRSALKQNADRTAAITELGLKPDLLTVLVMGGSQGASGINHAFSRIAPRLADMGLQIIHLTGDRDEDTVRQAYESAGIPCRVRAFDSEMQILYTASDIAVARSGASSLTELAFFGIPAILIPYPYASDDHQTHNAEVYSAHGAGIVLKEGDGLSEKLIIHLQRLEAEKDTRANMAAAARQHAPEAAAAKVADCLEAAVHHE